jgi:alpha-beta hydrolase superfamily lysophospholipase
MSILKIFLFILIVYIVICGLIYLLQEKLIFFPEKLRNDYQFEFYGAFEEINIGMRDGILLNGVLFRSDSSKGLIFYLHGNAGSLRGWGEIAELYTSLNYDLFMPDYRGYGKSEGRIRTEEQFFDDMQIAYENMKQFYPEDKIIILGYSIGTGAAVKLASANHPRLLILQAPFYSLIDLKNRYFPIIPGFLLKYKFETNKYIQDCKMPIVIFHGDKDEIIYYGSSLKLKELIKENDKLITLHGQYHNGMSVNIQYLEELNKILAE